MHFSLMCLKMYRCWILLHTDRYKPAQIHTSHNLNPSFRTGADYIVLKHGLRIELRIDFWTHGALSPLAAESQQNSSTFTSALTWVSLLLPPLTARCFTNIQSSSPSTRRYMNRLNRVCGFNEKYVVRYFLFFNSVSIWGEDGVWRLYGVLNIKLSL